MVKSELIKAVAAKTGMSQKATGEAIDAVVSVITETVSEGENVKLAGLGTFEVRDVPERIARNPQNGSQVTVEAHKALKFKASKVLKDAVR